jgi:JmjC domain, hydroxylase
MYNANRDRDEIGSTCLHQDVADAWNCLLYASNDGFALWHLWAAEDAQALDDFVCEEFGISRVAGSPILQQQVYLSLPVLARLKEVKNISPYTIIQRRGDIVFIPAGCPHQVR